MNFAISLRPSSSSWCRTWLSGLTEMDCPSKASIVTMMDDDSLSSLIREVSGVCNNAIQSLRDLSNIVPTALSTLRQTSSELRVTRAVIDRLLLFPISGSNPQSPGYQYQPSLQGCLDLLIQDMKTSLLDAKTEIARLRRYSISVTGLPQSLGLVILSEEGFAEIRRDLRRNRSTITLMLDCICSGILASIDLRIHKIGPNSTEKFANSSRQGPRVALDLRRQCISPKVQRLSSTINHPDRDRPHRADTRSTKKLHDAISKCDYPSVYKYLADGADPNATLKATNITPLHRALDLMEKMRGSESGSGSGSDTEKSPKGGTFTILAQMDAMKGYCDSKDAKAVLSILTALIVSGANLRVRDEEGRTPLIRAVKGDMGDCLVSLLLEYGGNLVNYQDNQQSTALHYAAMQRSSAKSKNLDLIRILLANGADPSIRNAKSRTPLYKAVMRGHLDRATELLNYGADLEGGSDHHGWAALHTAVLAGDAPMTQLLCHHGASYDGRDRAGQTSLHYAVSKGHVDVAAALLGAGADVNLLTKGETPLCRATAQGNLPIAKLLISWGANVSQPSARYFGAFPIHLAAMGDHRAVLELLLASGSPVDALDDRRRTPLQWAVDAHKDTTAEFLVSKGARRVYEG
ncbi:ankyrin repeat-containing domain protein [Apiospora arundinis]|uniref:Ankyrin repeat-containing domain protein n=1 Tax=Apiospora arundinis TaxID=335852 RepID=A0ABR2JGD2_9PEZI